VEDGFFEHRPAFPPNGKFRSVYAGSHGRAYNLRSVLAAARELPSDGFEFEFIGDGIDRAALQKEAQLMPQVRFLGGLPVEKMFERLYAAQAMVIPLADREALAATVPSKMADGWAAGLPVILAARKGELVELVRQNRAGIVVEPENPAALAMALETLRQNPSEAKEMGQRGRAFVRQTRLRSILVGQLEKMLLELIERKRGVS
jgi:glycosyltransferase involved in cell wall biosynthesis